MELKRSQSYIVAVESPIEFVVIGPKGGKDGICIRSDNMMPDLLGFAIRSNDIEEESAPTPSSVTLVYTVLFGTNRQLHLMTSVRLSQSDDKDTRGASLKLAWVGGASEIGTKRIRRAFDSAVLELQKSIDTGDVERLEWSLAPVLYECMGANERYKQRFRFLRAYLLSVALMTVVICCGVLGWMVLQQIIPPAWKR